MSNEITTDMSLALQNGICDATGNISLETYLTKCMDYLTLDTDNSVLKHKFLPTVFLRTDIAHVMNAVSRWKCFAKSPELK